MKQTKPAFEDIERVVREIILPFYQIERAIPLRFEGRSWENDAEHSWSVALVACMLAPHIDSKLDVGKVAQFAIVHDLAEVYAGDTNVFGADEHHATKEEREHAALRQIQKDFSHLPWLTTTLAEYEKQIMPEALYVRSIDKYLALVFDWVDTGRYYRDHKLTKKQFLMHIERPRAKASGHAGAFAYHEEVLKRILARDDFFHREDAEEKQ